METERNENEGLSDILRKLAYLGAGTIFYTQEGMQRVISDNLRVPKDAAAALAQQLEKGRNELVESFTKTFASALANVDFVEAARRGVDGLELDVKVKLSYPSSQMGDSPKKRATTPKAKSRKRTAPKSKS